MADNTNGKTNDTLGSCVPLHLTCTEMWSLAQQFAYLRLCEVQPARKMGLKCHDIYLEKEVDLLDDYRARALRIAATYARIYLETETDAYSNPEVMGRHAWYAFGAFASKTVFCVLNETLVRGISPIPMAPASVVVDAFGKGNFWLFMDIAPTAWMYNFSQQDFELCKFSRSTDNLVPEVKETVKSLPWADKVLPAIHNMPLSQFIIDGFKQTKVLETAIAAGTAYEALYSKVLKNLLLIAQHEQGEPVLQTITYDAWMRYAVSVQRAMESTPMIKEIMPVTQFIITPRCELLEGEGEEWRSLPHEGMKVEVYDDRMIWIGKTAKQFAGLLTDPQTRPNCLGSLREIAGWVNTEDSLASFGYEFSHLIGRR